MRDESVQGKKPVAVIVGGHGKIALLCVPRLVAAGYAVDSIIRNPEHADAVREAGARPVLLDIEHADTDALAEAFSSATAVIFSAGAGGGDPARTRAVDFEAATRTMDAALAAGVERYIMVSYARAVTDIDRLDEEDSFFPYAKAKHDADAYLRGTALDYTILGPGRLTGEPASGTVILVDESGEADGRTLTAEEKVTSRDNVAQVITFVLTTGAGRRETCNFYDGPTPIDRAFPA